MRFFIARAIVCCSYSVFCSASFAQPPKETASGPVEVTAWKVLTGGVAEDKAAKRAEAVAALGTIGPRRRELFPRLKPLLNDEKDAMRCMAAASIVRLSQGNPRAR